MRRTLAIATAAVMALFVGTTNGAAQQFDTHDRTFLTFSNAVELPGMRLEPGTYLFKLADTATRNVVQVMSQDEKQMLGQWFFAPAQRQDVTDDNVVVFRETSAGSTPAIQYWYYPSEKTGKEFMYPKDQALRIAQRTGASVLTESGRVTADQASGGIGVVEGNGLPEAQPKPVATDGRNDDRPVASAEAPHADAPHADANAQANADYSGAGSVRRESTVARNDAGQNELPHTSSPLALGGLISLLSLAGAAGLRALRR